MYFNSTNNIKQAVFFKNMYLSKVFIYWRQINKILDKIKEKEVKLNEKLEEFKFIFTALFKR